MLESGSQIDRTLGHLQEAVGIRFSQDVLEILRNSPSPGESEPQFPLGITTTKILLGLLFHGIYSNLASPALREFSALVGPNEIARLQSLYRELGPYEDRETARNPDGNSFPFSEETLELLERAAHHARQQDREITAEHLLIALVREPSAGCLWLFSDHPEIWDEVTRSLSHYESKWTQDNSEKFQSPNGYPLWSSIRKRLSLSEPVLLFHKWVVEVIVRLSPRSILTVESLFYLLIEHEAMHGEILKGVCKQIASRLKSPPFQSAFLQLQRAEGDPPESDFPMTLDCLEVWNEADQVRRQLESPFLSLEHFFAALLTYSKTGETPGQWLESEVGIHPDVFLERFAENVENFDPASADAWSKVLFAPQRAGRSRLRSEDLNATTRIPSIEQMVAIGDQLRNIGIRLSYCLSSSLSFACSLVLVQREKSEFGNLDLATFFFGFLKQGIRESGEPNLASRSLPGNLVAALGLDERDLNELTENVSTKPGDFESSLRLSDDLLLALQRSNEIRNRCSPKGDWVSARHFLGYLLDGSVSFSLPNGLSLADILDRSTAEQVLLHHLAFYGNEDDASQWEQLLGSTGASRPRDASLPGNEFQPKREANDHELCLNVDAYAQAVAQLLRDADKENDFVLAIYGPWGRGKTTLMRKVKPLLAPSSNTAEAGSYAFVDFSAWKYPTRPEVWIHLYEQITQRAVKVPVKPGKTEAASDKATPATKSQKDDSSRKSEPFVDSFWQKSRLAFRMGLLRSGWSPLLTGLIFLFITRLPLVEAVEWLRIGLGGFGALLLIGFAFSAFQFGRRLRMRYLSLPDHSESLGMQAVIGRDLANLLQVWLAPASANEPIPGQIDFRPGKPGFWGTFVVVLLIAATFVVAGLRIPQPAPTQGGSSKPPAGVTPPPSTPPRAPDTATPEPTTTAPQSAVSTPTPATSTPTPAASTPAPATLTPAPPEAAPAPSPAPPEILIRDLLQQWVIANPSQDTIQRPAPSIDSEAPPSPLAYWISVSVLSLAGIALICFFILLARPLIRHEKLLLTIDDLDRCEPDQMLAVIESLRLFLDNVQISRRLQVVMLVDQRFLGNALLKRARENGLLLSPKTQASRRYVREQREKFFVAELGLPQISPENLSEMINKHLGPGEPERSEPLVTPSVDTSPLQTANKTSGATLPEERLRDIKTNPGPGTESRPSSNQGTNSKPPLLEPKENTTPESPQTTRPTPNPIAAPIGFSTKTIQSVRFSKAERDHLLKAIPELHQNEATPRQIRASVVRYQLARMLLHHLGRPMTEDSVSEILHAIRAQLDSPSHIEGVSVIDQVAHSVVCPDIAYSDESPLISSASPSE